MMQNKARRNLILKTMMVFVIGTLLSSLTAFAASNQNIIYQGRIVRPDGTVANAGNISFSLAVYSPAPSKCLLYSESQTLNMAGSQGMFTLLLGSGTRTDGGSHSFAKLFMNGGALTGLTCASGTSYTPTSTDDRDLVVAFNDNGTVVTLSAMAIKSVPFALQAAEIGGYGINDIVKVHPTSGSPTTFTTAEMAKIRGIGAAACAANEILKWNGTAWICSPDATGGAPTDAAYGSSNKGIVAFDTDAATSGITVASGVAKLSNTGVSANTYGSATAVPAIAIDAQGRITSASATTIALPVSQLTQSGASNGQVLKWNGSAWAPAADVGVTADASYAAKGVVQFDTDAETSGVSVTSGVAKVNTGVGANQIVKLDGTGKLPAVDGSALTNITATGYSGVLPVANGGTNSNTALNNNRLMVSSGGKIVEAAAMNDGQILIGSTGAAPVVATVGQSNGISITSGAGSLSIATNATTANTASTIVSRDASGNFAAGAVTNTSNILKGGTSGQITMTVPGTVTPYTLTWPSGVGSAGSFLTTDASGNLSWGSPAAIADSSYAAKGAVQFDTDAATSGVSVTSGVASINAGTGANQIVKLNGSAQLPAVDGSLLTNLSAGNISTGVLPIARGGTNNGSLAVTAGGVLYMDGSKAMTTTAGTSGQALLSAGAGAPAFGNLGVPAGGTGTTSFAANSLVMANGTGSALTGMTCSLGQILKWDGTAWSCAAGASAIADAAYTSSNKGVVAFDTDAATSGVLVTSGVARVNTGTNANQIVKLDGSAKLPAVDGSALTNVTASAYSGVLPIANGGTNSNTALNNNKVMVSSGGAIVEGNAFGSTNAASTFVTRDASGNFAAGAVTNTSNILKATTGALTMTVPGTVTDYTLTWPAAVGSAGAFLTTDASGNLSWGSPAAIADSSYAAKGAVQFLTNAATSGINVSSGVASVNTGTGANQIVKLDASAKLPAVDGSELTNISAGNLTGTVPPGSGGTGQSSYTAGDMLYASGATATSKLGIGASGTILTSTGSAPQWSTIGSLGFFVNGGNTFTGTATLGSNSNHNLEIETNGVTRMTIGNDGNVGIGTSPGYKFTVADTTTKTTSGTHWSSVLSTSLAPTSASLATATNFESGSYFNGTVNSPSAAVIALKGTAQNDSAFTLGEVRSLYLDTINNTTGTITDSYGAYNTTVNLSTGTIDKAYGYYVDIVRNSTGPINTGYGLYTGTIDATNKWSIYASDATAPSYFAGKVGIGTTTPLSPLDVNGVLRLGTDATSGADLITSRQTPFSSTEAFSILGTRYSSGGMFIGYGVQAGATGANPYLSSVSDANRMRSVAHFGTDIEFLTAASQTTAVGSPITGLTTAMVIRNSGYVGLNATNPGTTLDVNGAITQRGIAAPGTSPTGQGIIYFDSTANKFKVSENGAAYVDLVGGGSSGVTGVTAGTGLLVGTTAGGTISTTGTLNINVGTGANQIVQLDGTGKLRAHDGSALTNLNASNFTSGTLPVGRGGTGLTAGTSGGIPYFNATSTMASSGLLTANGVVLGGGAGAAPTTTAAGAAYSVLRVPSGGGAPAFGAIDLTQSAAVTGTLPIGNGGTGASSLAANRLVGTNGTGTAQQAVTCSLNQVLSFDASGNYGCYDVSTIFSGAFANGGNTFTATATVGTNSNHNLEFETNGTTKMTILADGKIGMGTATPHYSLQVHKAASVDNLIQITNSATGSAASDGFQVGAADDGNGFLWNKENSGMEFGTNDSLRMYIAADGKVGIGAGNNPGATFHVVGTSAFENASATSAGPTFSFWKSRNYAAVANNDELGFISFYGHGGSGVNRSAYIASYADAAPTATSSPGRLQFFTTAAGNADATARMTIKSDGKVGIGLTSPDYQLDVANNARIGAADSSPGLTITNWSSSAARYPGIMIQNYTGGFAGSNGIGGQTFRGSAVTPAAAQSGDILFEMKGSSGLADWTSRESAKITFSASETATSTSSAGHIGLYTTPSSSTTPVERVRLTKEGRLGVGTATPFYKLDIHETDGPVGIRVVNTDSSAARQPTVIVENYMGSANTGKPSFATQNFRGNGNSPLPIASGDPLGIFIFAGSSDNAWNTRDGAYILSNATQNFTNSASGSNLSFWTSANGSTAPAERVRIDQNGNVGIGTTTASEKLTVQTGAGAYGLLHTVGTVSVGTWVDANVAQIGTKTNHPLEFFTNDGAAQITLRQNGNVGIGVTSPNHALSINRSSGNAYTVIGSGNSDAGFQAWGARGVIALNSSTSAANTGTKTIISDSGKLFIGKVDDAWSTETTHMTILDNGNVGIGFTSPTHKLQVVGTAGLSTGTAWTNTSDIRVKDIEGDYEHGLDEILKLNTVRFHYKKNNPLGLSSEHPMTGFIAQEVQKVIPEAVTTRADGYLELNVDPIHWATVNAVQDLHGMCKMTDQQVQRHSQEIQKIHRALASVQAENEKLKKDNERISKENAAMKKDLEAIKKKLGL